MASPGTVPVPCARIYPFIASAGDLTYLWGGLNNTEPEAVFIYDHDTEVWTRRLTSGRHPPAGLSEGGCTMSGHNLYLYGGYDNTKRNCGDLYELNTQTWQWRKLCDGSAGGPGKKYECRMISYQDQLLVVGGCYDEMPTSTQAGAKYTTEGSSVYTNEVHVYNLTTGLWLSPVKGSRPLPCSSFSLTKTNEDCAIMFGGSTPSGKSSEAHALHLPTMTWSQHKEGEGDPWPESRWDHIAACLGYGEPHQKLLISGGVGGSLTFDDIWLLDPQSGRMEEVQVPVKYKQLIQRHSHAAAVIAKSACEVIIFGGKKDHTGSSIADQVVLKFEFQKGKWCLTDIASNNKDDTIRRLEQHLKDSRVKEKDLQKRAEKLETQVIDVNKRAEELQTQMSAANRKAEASNKRAGELQKLVDDAKRRSKASNKRDEELQTQVNAANRKAEASNRRAEASNRRAAASNRRAGELQIQVQDANRRAGEWQTLVDDANGRAGELQTQVEDANRRAEASNRRAGELQTQLDDANSRAEASNRRAGEMQRQVQDAENRMQDLERYLAETTQELRQCEDISTHWVVSREEIELTGPELGAGGWATVTVANFRGTRVAVKRIHNEIISRHNLQLFQREMNMAARLRHPNLIQFIGATIEGGMMIVMELMATSLRSQLKIEEYFPPKVVKAISLDVARGLNYLHLIQPDPIVHRDISSANVLLEQLTLNNWRAKLTDYGSVNLVRQLRTENPGSPAYAAPEASNPHLQSPKIDIYSFGALVLEMLTGRLPAPDNRLGMFRKVQHEQLLHLIRRCLNGNPEDRPSASDIISELSPQD